MNALSLYSGGCDGMGIAAAWSGINTLAYCDSEEACRALLRYRHPDKPIFESDMEVTLETLRAKGIDTGTIDMVYGAPPCQCASVAGKRSGADDPRNRWPQFLRIVREIRPRWVMAENVPGLLSVDDGWLFGGILRELAQAGYTVGWQCWSAADVGAPHKRERLFIVGHSAISESGRIFQRGVSPDTGTGGVSADVGNTECGGCTGNPRGRAGQEPANGHIGALANARNRKLQVRNAEPRNKERNTAGFTRCSDIMAHSHDTEAARHGLDSGKVHCQPKPKGLNLCGSKGRRPAQSQLGRDTARIPAGMDAITGRLEAQKWPAGKGPYQYDWEPPRVATGIPDRATRLKMIGNACPPQQYYIMMALINLIRA